ncbi:hypothetical protein DFP72DRAFT_900533 [Ephemerocybe angulata]|uniref:Secreted protein n=1 Tax=Ephemerocybe angulata TaxID=980116 RepID=A0A8H6HXV3_9AGAR|nr:hypothetical protein DFP72DRAFT_900533 [Tulosesus angulatus]
MRFTTSLSALLVTLCSTGFVLADHLTTYAGGGHSTGTWTTGFGTYTNINTDDGCHNNPGPPALTFFCIDWPNRRLHFVFANQAKRCMRQVSSDSYNCNGGTCQRGEWDEVGCTWKEEENVGDKVEAEKKDEEKAK